MAEVAPTSDLSMPDNLRYSERMLWARAERNGDSTVLTVLERLSRYRRRVKEFRAP